MKLNIFLLFVLIILTWQIWNFASGFNEINLETHFTPALFQLRLTKTNLLFKNNVFSFFCLLFPVQFPTDFFELPVTFILRFATHDARFRLTFWNMFKRTVNLSIQLCGLKTENSTWLYDLQASCKIFLYFCRWYLTNFY